MVASMLLILRALLVVLAGGIELADVLIESAELVVHGRDVSQGTLRTQSQPFKVTRFCHLSVSQQRLLRFFALAGLAEALVMHHADLLDALGAAQGIVRSEE